MDIGKEEKKTIVVEPIVEPVRQLSKEPAPVKPRPEKFRAKSRGSTSQIWLVSASPRSRGG